MSAPAIAFTLSYAPWRRQGTDQWHYAKLQTRSPGYLPRPVHLVQVEETKERTHFADTKVFVIIVAIAIGIGVS